MVLVSQWMTAAGKTTLLGSKGVTWGSRMGRGRSIWPMLQVKKYNDKIKPIKAEKGLKHSSTNSLVFTALLSCFPC